MAPTSLGLGLGLTRQHARSSAASGVVIPSTSARYWRFRVTAFNSHPSIGELQFALLGQAMATPSAYISSGDFSGLPASQSFDGNLATAWAAATAVTDVWVGVDFGAAVDVNVVRIAGRAGFGQYPTAGAIEYSSDGSSWTTAWSVSGLTASGTDANVLPANGTMPAFPDPNKTGANKVMYRLLASAHDADATTICELRFSSASGGANLLSGLGAYLFASDSINSTNVPNQIVDASNATFWASTALPVALAAELDAGYTITEIGIVPRDNGSGAAYQFPTDFKLQSTPDGLTWTDEHSYAGLTTGWAAGVERVLTV